MARACTRTRASGRQVKMSSTAPTPMRSLAIRPVTISAAYYDTPMRCAHSWRQPQTPTGDWCPATRRRSISSIRNATEALPIDKDLYDLPPQEAAKVKSMPGSLEESLSALENDHAFLLKGDVFTRDVIETWLTYKRKKELDAIRLRPHPHEFALYFDI